MKLVVTIDLPEGTDAYQAALDVGALLENGTWDGFLIELVATESDIKEDVSHRIRRAETAPTVQKTSCPPLEGPIRTILSTESEILQFEHFPITNLDPSAFVRVPYDFEQEMRPHLATRLREQDCGLREAMGDEHGHTSCMWFNFAANEIDRLRASTTVMAAIYVPEGTPVIRYQPGWLQLDAIGEQTSEPAIVKMPDGGIHTVVETREDGE